MKGYYPLILTLFAGLALSCGGIDSGADSGSFSWNGTWTSSVTFDVRGTFFLDAARSEESLSGTVVLCDRAGNELLAAPVSGEVSEEDDSRLYISFISTDTSVYFHGSAYGVDIEDLDDFTFISGEYSWNGDAGDWHTAPAGTVDDCVITEAIMTSPALSIRDLCADESWLYAVTDSAVYRIDPSKGECFFLLSCAELKGVARGNGFFWVTAGNENDGFKLYKYSASWELQGGYPKDITGAPYVSAIGWHDGGIICPYFFFLNTLDPDTAVCTMGSGIDLRSIYAEGDGTDIWVTFSPTGDEWNSFVKLLGGSVFSRDIPTPDREARPFTLQGDYLWVASLNGGLYKISLK